MSKAERILLGLTTDLPVDTLPDDVIVSSSSLEVKQALKQLYDLCVAEANTYTTYRGHLETVHHAVPLDKLAQYFGQKEGA